MRTALSEKAMDRKQKELMLYFMSNMAKDVEKIQTQRTLAKEIGQFNANKTPKNFNKVVSHLFELKKQGVLDDSELAESIVKMSSRYASEIVLKEIDKSFRLVFSR